MTAVTVLAPAKINLTLSVTGRRPDGYHEVDTVMQTVDLCDRVTAERTADGGITLCVSDAALPADSRNTAYRAAERFLARAGIICPGVRLTVEKHIPMQAGLAGGSADAAGVLFALDRLFPGAVAREALFAAAAEVGADVPFCLAGGAARAVGIGTELIPCAPLPPCTVLIVKPEAGVSTADAYRAIDSVGLLEQPDTAGMLRALASGDLAAVSARLGNVFEQAVALPATARIRQIALAHGALGCRMSGSGSAVFALFAEKDKAAACREACAREFPFAALCRPCGGPAAEKNGKRGE